MAATTPRPVLSGPLRAAVAHLTASALQELRARVADEVAAAVAADAGREHLRRLGHLVRAIDDRLVAADDDPPTLERRLAIAAERDRLKAAGGRVPACTRSEGGTSPGARATSTVAADRSSAANSRRSPRPSRQR